MEVFCDFEVIPATPGIRVIENYQPMALKSIRTHKIEVEDYIKGPEVNSMTHVSVLDNSNMHSNLELLSIPEIAAGNSSGILFRTQTCYDEN